MATFREKALENGYHLAVIPIARLADLRTDIEEFAATQELNDWQRNIVSSYTYEPKELPFEAKSVIVTAGTHPSHGEAVFKLGGREYKVYVVEAYSEMVTEKYLGEELSKLGYSHAPTPFWFPEKRFAVQSGLCEYGRNNIVYMPGYGSYIGLDSYYSDMPPDEDLWRSVVTAEQCEGCSACENHCPTGAIIPGQYLIDNSRCLAGINEGRDDEFPDFIPKNAHHTTVNCLRCQYNCPMNVKSNEIKYPTVHFDEAETERLMRGAPYDDLEGEFKEKFDFFSLGFAGNLPRNLRACFDIVDSGGECSLK